jgi:hypothetical protein
MGKSAIWVKLLEGAGGQTDVVCYPEKPVARVAL